ncbi:MAG: hypothetical protein IH889_03355 [Planctomycetes bacterium]|nr:hypothetical protein [Planctomycetota bacterium]
MTLRSRVAAIERAARRRRWRHPAAMMPAPPMKFDDDRETAEVLARLTALRERTGLVDPLAFARKVMEDVELAARYRAVIRAAMAAGAASPVDQTGDVEHEG